MKSVSELFSYAIPTLLKSLVGKEKCGCVLRSQGCLMLWFAVLEC